MSTVRVKLDQMPEHRREALRRAGQEDEREPGVVVLDGDAFDRVMAGGDGKQRCRGCGD